MIAVEPSESQVLAGGKPGPHKIQGIGAGMIPTILNRKMIDRVIPISTEQAVKVAREVIRQEGIPVGISSGAALAAALQVAQESTQRGKQIVVIIPSYTERYLSTVLAEAERQQAQSLVVEGVDESWIRKVDEIFHG